MKWNIKFHGLKPPSSILRVKWDILLDICGDLRMALPFLATYEAVK
jgi:hypothetical protein